MERRLDTMLALVLASAAILVTVGDWMGALDSAIRERVPVATIALLAFLTSLVLIHQRRDTETRDAIHRLRAQIDALVAPHSFSWLAIVYGLKNARLLTTNAEFHIDRGDFQDFWFEAVAVCHTWLAVNYTLLSDSWSRNQNHPDSAAQRAAIQGGAIIKRVFLFDSEDEFRAYLPIMTSQEAVGVEVRWRYMADVRSDHQVSGQLKDHPVDSWSFAVVDNEWMYWRMQDRRRKILSARACRRDDDVRAARQLFQLLFERGRSLPELAVESTSGVDNEGRPQPATQQA